MSKNKDKIIFFGNQSLNLNKFFNLNIALTIKFIIGLFLTYDIKNGGKIR